MKCETGGWTDLPNTEAFREAASRTVFVPPCSNGIGSILVAAECVRSLVRPLMKLTAQIRRSERKKQRRYERQKRKQ